LLLARQARPLAPGVYLLASVSAVDIHAREHAPHHDTPGSEADAWFSALDERLIELGRGTCVARVMGIHTSADGLWIQVTFESEIDLSVVVHVTSATRLEDVLHRLKIDPPVGRPLEVIDMEGPHSTPAAARVGRANAAGRLPTPRDAH
jgi:hypothetical protein